MDIDAELPLEKQIIALREIKQKFEAERKLIKDKILTLEQTKAKAVEMVRPEDISEAALLSQAKVSTLSKSIADVKSFLASKGQEIQFISDALELASKLLEAKEAEADQQIIDELQRKKDELLLQLRRQTELETEQVHQGLLEEVEDTLESLTKEEKKDAESSLEQELAEVEPQEEQKQYLTEGPKTYLEEPEKGYSEKQDYQEPTPDYIGAPKTYDPEMPEHKEFETVAEKEKKRGRKDD